MKLLSILLFLVSQLAWAETAKLVDVSSSRAGDVYTDILTFDREIPAEEYSIDFINETVQVNIPGANLNGRKKFKPIKDDLVKSLYTYQVDEDLLRHRIILQKGHAALKFEDRVSIVKSGKKLLVKVMSEASAPKPEPSAFKSILKELPPKSKKPVVKKAKDADLESVRKLVVSGDVRPREIKGKVKDQSEEISAKDQKSKKVRAEKRELAESEIPVLAAKTEKKAGDSGTYWRLVLSFALILVVAGALWFGMKRYRHNGLSKNKHNSIKMLTQHYIGPKKSLAIVSVAGESILIGVTDHSINHIKTLSLLEEEVPAVAEGSFSESLAAAEHQPADEEDEFSIRGIKDLVSTRLQGMRDI